MLRNVRWLPASLELTSFICCNATDHRLSCQPDLILGSLSMRFQTLQLLIKLNKIIGQPTCHWKVYMYCLAKETKQNVRKEWIRGWWRPKVQSACVQTFTFQRLGDESVELSLPMVNRLMLNDLLFIVPFASWVNIEGKIDLQPQSIVFLIPLCCRSVKGYQSICLCLISHRNYIVLKRVNNII